MKTQTLYYVWCEYDVGFNIDGHKGVYSTRENLDQAIGSALKNLYPITLKDLEEDGLLDWETIEG